MPTPIIIGRGFNSYSDYTLLSSVTGPSTGNSSIAVPDYDRCSIQFVTNCVGNSTASIFMEYSLDDVNYCNCTSFVGTSSLSCSMVFVEGRVTYLRARYDLTNNSTASVYTISGN